MGTPTNCASYCAANTAGGTRLRSASIRSLSIFGFADVGNDHAAQAESYFARMNSS